MNAPAIIDHEQLVQRILAAERSMLTEVPSYFKSIQSILARMIVTGKVLRESRVALKGRFLEWIECHHDANPLFPAQATAYRRMQLVQYEALASMTMAEVMKEHEAEWNNACRIMQLNPPSNGEREVLPELEKSPFKLGFSISDSNPEAWTQDARKEYLEKARPVVELYRKVEAVSA